MKVLISILIFMITFVYWQEQPNLAHLQCSSINNCNSCASRDDCVWCNGYNKCLSATPSNLGTESTQCYNNNGGSLVLLGASCSMCK